MSGQTHEVTYGSVSGQTHDPYLQALDTDTNEPEDYDGLASTNFFEIVGSQFFKKCKECDLASFVCHTSPYRIKGGLEGCLRKNCKGCRGVGKVKELWRVLLEKESFRGKNGL